MYEDASFIRTNTGFTFQNPDEGGEIGDHPGAFYLATSVTNGTPAATRTCSRRVNGYGMFDDLPVVQEHARRGVLRAPVQQAQRRGVLRAARTSGSSRTSASSTSSTTAPSLPANTGRDQYASYAEVDLLLFDWLNLRGTFDFLKVSGNRNQTRYQIGAEPFIDRFIQPRLYYVINNGPGNQPQLNTTQLVFELHFFF